VGTGVAVRERAAAVERPVRESLTRFHQRIAAESIAARGGSGVARLAPALAQAAVDLNPHQVEAAAFALKALATGGAVLADEVGLGKTIEAGLVMAQLAAEGRGRALVLVPASLRLQWRDELRDKFGIEATVLDGPSARASERQGLKNPFDRGGVVIASQPFGAQRADDLARVPWDLAVVDEAHRLRNAWRPDHRTGQALRRALRRCPKLLLTATPLQNDLTELLGLTSFIDDALLGSEESFRLRYGAGELSAEQAADLRERLGEVVVRTLRRQVKEHVRFTARRSMVEDFTPTPEEQELYRRVSDWLRREDSLAIPPGRRALMVLVYRKILASSSFALAATLERLADSLDARLGAGRGACAARAEPELEGFEEEAEEWGEGGDPAPGARVGLRALRAEASELRACARAARAIRANAKGEALVRGIDRAFTVARACGWPEKAVVFTEFRRTQEHLAELLRSRGHAVTCLSGDAGGPSRRQALVEEFRRRTSILLMTEAGAEGLNLQFCNLVVNYDLPWNPQRIEQRIGRCHRYGQERDVLVVNFLNRANAADARLYELLGQKLSLFDGVFGSSDEVLGSLGSGVDFERRVLDIYQSCRSAEEIDRAFAALRADLDARIQARLAAARALLLERFDGEVRSRLRLAEREVRDAVSRREAEEEALVRSLLEPGAAAAAPGEPAPRARRARLARAAAESVRARSPEPVSFLELDARALPVPLSHLAGREGWWFAYRFAFEGLAPEERVAHLVLWSDGQAFRELGPEAAEAFARVPAREARGTPAGAVPVGPAQEAALAALEARLLAEAGERGAAILDQSRERWDRGAEDALAVPRRAAEEARAAWERARGALHREGGLPLPDRRTLLARAERDWRRRLDALRAAEAQRYGEKDRALAELRQRADPRPRRTLVAAACWRCR
jgi:superfamily II DNA or RNA helicase